MTRRNAYLKPLIVSAVLSAMVTTGSVARAQALEPSPAVASSPATFEIKKLNLWPTRYFTLIHSDGARVVAMAESPLFASYTFYNASYAAFAEARSVHTGPTAMFFAGGTLQVVDKTGAYVGTLRGHYFTMHRAKFTLEDPVGQVLAEATLNSQGTVVQVVDAKAPTHILATLERLPKSASVENAGSGGSQDDIWKVTLHDGDALPHDMLRTLATYIIDYQDWFFWSDFSPNLGQEWVASTKMAVQATTSEMVAKEIVDAVIGFFSKSAPPADDE